MANLYDPDQMFMDFFRSTQEALSLLEVLFGVDGACDQVLGGGPPAAQQQSLLASPAWGTLTRLREYALLGRLGGRETQDIVIDGANVLALVTTENVRPEESWRRILAMADARSGLDNGDPVELGRVALLANVDVRTVRNAVSSGELLSTKEGGLQFIDNASARRWLAGRRGFKPTEVDDGSLTLAVGSVATPVQFAALLASRRKDLALDARDSKLVVLHPAVSPPALAKLEAGVFSLPLDAVFPVADFYQLPRKEFLACVMRVFFRAELDALVGLASPKEAA